MNNKTLIEKLKKKKHHEIDELFLEAHHNAFACTDCLQCANCCKTTGPLFTNNDIDRLAKHFNIKPAKFIAQYLKIDEDNDYVLQQLPCPFLFIYLFIYLFRF